MIDVPAPRMQKLTTDELWRCGVVRSPGSNTLIETLTAG